VCLPGYRSQGVSMCVTKHSVLSYMCLALFRGGDLCVCVCVQVVSLCTVLFIFPAHTTCF